MTRRRERFSLIVLAMVVMPSILIGIGQIYVTGIDGVRLCRPETIKLLLEIAALFVLEFFCILLPKNNRARAIAAVTAVSFFAWLHQVLLPLLLSGLYVAALIRCGGAIRRVIDGKKRFTEYHRSTCMVDLTLGCGSVILLFCLMSLVGIGGIPYTRAAIFLLTAATFLPAVSGREECKRMRERSRVLWTAKEGGPSLPAALLLAFIISMLLLQAGRMNICADYDSLHYGLRSEHILNDGRGIYENMGSINVVYTYSKGLEILLFPLSGLPSYSFILSFQLWMTVGILCAADAIVGLFARRECGILCMAILSSIPGIMNMGITAKTDSATAMFQLLMIYFLLLYVKKQKMLLLAAAGNAFFMTMVLKPTALVFSTMLAGTAFVFFLVTKRFKLCLRERFLLSWIPMLCMWGLVWLRTWRLTGLPVTSVFYSVWERLGFEVRYPFRVDTLPANGGDLLSLSGIKHLLKRLYGVLLAPVGDDMAHVRIAWGTPYLLIFLVLFCLPLFVRMDGIKKRNKAPLLCLICLFLADGAVSLAALYLLWQVDGNYFILLYTLSAVLAAILISKISFRPFAYSVIKVLIPVALFNVSITAVSNWSGTLGLSPVKLLHTGYYDHRTEEKIRMEQSGNGRIWELLAEDDRNRVIVFGEQPRMLLFPCNAQSYTDIEGSGGNFLISASPEALAAYLEYAQTDYAYFGSGYLKPGTEAFRNVTELIRKGYLTDIYYENGNGLAKFVTEPELSKALGELDTFTRKYWPGEQQ